jgi:hypothetical protein
MATKGFRRVLCVGAIFWITATASQGAVLGGVNGEAFGHGAGSAEVSFFGDQLVTISSTFDPTQEVDIQFHLDWDKSLPSKQSLVDLNLHFTGPQPNEGGYRFLLGSGVGTAFQQSGDFDFLTIQGVSGASAFSQESLNEISWPATDSSPPADGFDDAKPAEFDFTVRLPVELEAFTLRQVGALSHSPEPTTMILLGSGLVGLAALRKIRSRGHGSREQDPA